MTVSEALARYGANGPILVKGLSSGSLWLMYDKYFQTDINGNEYRNFFREDSNYEVIDWFEPSAQGIEDSPILACTLPHECVYDVQFKTCVFCGAPESTTTPQPQASATSRSEATHEAHACVCDMHTVVLRIGCQCGGI